MSSMIVKSDRISSDERRAQILEAAVGVFGRYGYSAATTDRVARAAGISQPYVVRLFGTKEQLFIETLRHTLALLLHAFRAAIDEPATDGRSVEARLGSAYVELVEDRGVLLTLLHGFMMGTDPVIGPVARDGFMQVYLMLRDEAGFSPEEARRFLADGMLINTLLASGLGLQVSDDSGAAELFSCTFGDKLHTVLEHASA